MLFAKIAILSLTCFSVEAFRRQKKDDAGRMQIDDTVEADPLVAPEVDVSAFVGRWYQMYNSVSSTLFTFGNSGPQDTCVSADYSLDQDGTTINVLNQGIRLDGRVTKIWGKVAATEDPAKKKLSFSKFLRGDEVIEPPKFEGDYWIYFTGPKLKEGKDAGKYAYVIVGAPTIPSLSISKTQLFVLARDPFTWKELYATEVLTWLKENGFDVWWNKPRETGSIGGWQWTPPKFKFIPVEERKYGEFGQTGCAKVEGLLPPAEGADPRT